MRIPAEGPALRGVVLIFRTMDELRYAGPLALKMWLERNRPIRRPGPCAGEVLEFRPDHEAFPKEEP